MKIVAFFKNNLIYLFFLFAFFGCTEDVYKPDNTVPVFISASVDINQNNRVTAVFNEDLNTAKDGFSIKVDDENITIISIEGSGTRYITFILETTINYGQSVTISYNANVGNASNDANINLSSFTEQPVTNNIAETELSVLISNIPPEAKNDTIWLVLKTGESASTWEWDYKRASINIYLTANTDIKPFDIIVFITEDGDWRPDMPLGNGYYATLLSQTNKYQELKVVTWIKASSLSGTNMGYINSELTDVENTSLDNAFTLRTDGMDYVEGNILDNSYKLWYQFVTVQDVNYQIIIKDNYSNSDDFTGIVKGIVCDEYGIPLSGVSDVIGDHPIIITGKGENVYVWVEKSDLGGELGTFQIIALKQ
ncbi:MAG: hypothetical protein GXO79_07695 [Chlorobi bacterium]|nr:hypothetical protein [Chlorobiota bacterium]